jgi:hypothetical protein
VLQKNWSLLSPDLETAIQLEKKIRMDRHGSPRVHCIKINKITDEREREGQKED